MKHSALFLLISFISLSANAQNLWNPAYKQAYNESLSLNFSKSDSILSAQKNKITPTEAYIRAQSHFTKIMLNDFEKDEIQADSLSYFLEKINLSPLKSVWLDFYRVEILMMKSLVNAKIGHNMNSVLNIYKAAKLTNSIIEIHPDFSPIHTLNGLQLCTFSQIPDNYKSFAAFFGLEGNYKKGIKEIERSIRQNKDSSYDFMKDKEKFIYVFAIKEFGDVNSVRISDEIKNYHKNPILLYYESYLLYKDSKIEEARDLLIQNEILWKNKFNYLNYFTGKLLTFEIDNRAKKYLFEFIENAKTDDFKKSGYRYLSYLELIKGNTQKYRHYKYKTLDKKINSISETDKSAENEVLFLDNPTLVKAQLIYDGGNYNEAKKTLLSKNREHICKNSNDYIIYYYRLAGIYYKLNDYNKAIENYKRCTAFQFNNKLHYQANAYLKLGELYLIKNNIKKSRVALEKCLELADFPYSYSIHSKAKKLLTETKN
ncbi:MAG: tetratricopeptide repeat protein [Bacteroidota bacterium]